MQLPARAQRALQGGQLTVEVIELGACHGDRLAAFVEAVQQLRLHDVAFPVLAKGGEATTLRKLEAQPAHGDDQPESAEIVIAVLPVPVGGAGCFRKNPFRLVEPDRGRRDAGVTGELRDLHVVTICLQVTVRSRAYPTRREGTPTSRPSVLFLCVHNAGRSQMAAGFMRQLGNDKVDVYSGGSEPATQLNAAAVAAMAEKGIDISREMPQVWADEEVRAADVIVTMGCGDACPFYPGKRYVDWELDDPSGKGVEEVRPIRDEIERRVRGLMDELGVDPAASS
jgi:protein-tyrosine-phosphatase